MGKWAKAVVPLSGIYCTARREKNDWDKCTKQIIYVCFIFGMLFIEREKKCYRYTAVCKWAWTIIVPSWINGLSD